jgi:hypothetical protein
MHIILKILEMSQFLSKYIYMDYSSIPIKETLKSCLLCDKIIIDNVITMKLKDRIVYFHKPCYDCMKKNVNLLYDI